jgi:hypothetical protein
MFGTKHVVKSLANRVNFDFAGDVIVDEKLLAQMFGVEMNRYLDIILFFGN